jgi:acyl-CoA thioesterase
VTNEDLLRRYMSRDRLATTLGMEIVDIGPGRSEVRMRLDERHLNGAGIAHGGAIFSLADVAFAAASNAHGTLAVALDVTISFVKAATTGVLTARAEELSLGSRTGVYGIRVTNDLGEVVALFQGTVYRKKTPIADLIARDGSRGEADR